MIPYKDRTYADREDAQRSCHGTTTAEYYAYIDRSIKSITEELEIDATDTILDIGCGLGDIGAGIAETADRYVGVDINVEMLKFAESTLEHHNNVDLLVRVTDTKHPLKELIGYGDLFSKIFAQSVFIHLNTEQICCYLRDIDNLLYKHGLAMFKYCTINHNPEKCPQILESNTADINAVILDLDLSTIKSWEAITPTATTRTMILTK